MKKKILWVDDEVNLLRPHLLLLHREGYHVDAIMNGNDALALLENESYDLVLLDEQMPGLRGIEVLSKIRSREPNLPVVMVTKSEAESTLHEAIGGRADDYIVKPTSPRQVLSVVTRILAGPQLRLQQTARDFTQRFQVLRELAGAAASWSDWADIYSEMVDWELRLEEQGESSLVDVLHTLRTDVRRGYCELVADRYAEWVHEDGEAGPPLSVDVLSRFFKPVLTDDSSALLMVVDCLRLDQWRAFRPLLTDLFDVQEVLYAGILPTATPFARNAIFSGLFPDELEESRPGWLESGEDEGYNSFEDDLFATHVQKLAGEGWRTHYEKLFTATDGERMLQRLPSYLAEPSATALVFSFVDMLTHGRSESHLLWEVARDASALRALTVSWFERSAAFGALRLAARTGTPVLLTTDHGSIHCNRPVTVFAKRDATASLRYKFGHNLRVEHPAAVYQALTAGDLRMPELGTRRNHILCREDYFFVYPTKLREYQARYRDSFLHGGISPEEMILPVALLLPR